MRREKKDFVSKLEIALKESNETSYWLKLLYKTGRIDASTLSLYGKNVRQHSQTVDCLLQNSERKCKK